MAKERLSRFQKWILVAVYQTGEEGLRRRRIYKSYFGLKPEGRWDYRNDRFYHWSNVHGSPTVVLSRSLKRLREKDLVYMGCGWRLGIIYLTNEGIEKAKSLMLVSQLTNNKKGGMKNEQR